MSSTNKNQTTQQQATQQVKDYFNGQQQPAAQNTGAASNKNAAGATGTNAQGQNQAQGSQQQQNNQQKEQIKVGSLSLKCATHKEEAIIGICFQKECKFQSRLMCFQCVFGDHAEHVKNSIQVKELDDTEKNGVFLDNWPQQPVCKDIRKFLKQQQVSNDGTLDQKIDKLKQEAGKEFQNVQTIVRDRTQGDASVNNQEDIKQLNTEAAKIFKLETVSKDVKEFSEKKITTGELNQRIADFVAIKQNDEDIERLNKKYMSIKQKQKLLFLPEEFEQISEQILNLIRSIPDRTLISNSLNFRPAAIKESQDNFKLLDNGLILSFEKDSDSGPVMAVSDILRPETLYMLELKVEGEFSNNMIRFSLIQDEFIDEYPENLYYCIVKGSRDMYGPFSMLGVEWLHVNNLRGSIKIRISVTDNVFAIQSGDERGGVMLNGFKFNCTSSSSKKWRLAIINVGRPVRICKLASTIDHS